MATITICSDFGASKNKFSHCFHCFPIYLPWFDGTGCHDLHFWMLSFKPTFSLSTFTFIKRLFSCKLIVHTCLGSFLDYKILFHWSVLSFFLFWSSSTILGFSGSSAGKEYACNAGDPVQSLGWEDPLKKGMATHSSFLAWRISWTEEPGGLQSTVSQRVRHDWATKHACTKETIPLLEDVWDKRSTWLIAESLQFT